MKYSDEEIQVLRERWEKPLLKPDSFTRDENGKVEGGEVLQGGIEGCNSFQELLTKRLQEIETKLVPQIDGIKKSLDHETKRMMYNSIYQSIAEDDIKKTVSDIGVYGLDCFIVEKEEKFTVINHNGKYINGVSKLGEYQKDFRFANLENRVFCGAELEFALFDCANCKGANFEFALFNGADFSGAYCFKTRFTGGVFTGAFFLGTMCFGADFTGSDFRGCHFEEGIYHRAVFNDAQGENAIFDGSKCLFSSFNNANLFMASFGVKEKVLENGEIQRNPCDLTGATWDSKSSFLGVDTSNVDWSKNPRMKRFIEQQQYVHAAKEGIDEKFGKRKITKPIGWGLKKLVSLIDYLSDPLNWFFYAIATILIFATIHAFCFDAIKYANDVNWFTPIYYSVVTFSTLGFGDIAPITWYSQLLAVVEVIVGYIFLGGLVTFLANWLGRR